MNIEQSKETHFGINWDRFDLSNEPQSYFFNDWCIDLNIKGHCWTLWHGLDLVVENESLTLLFMIARELILEDIADGFAPSWAA